MATRSLMSTTDAGTALESSRLVTSDSHLGLKQAVAEVLVGATWQRCRVRFMRNALATVPKLAQQMAAATLRPIFAQADADSARDTLERDRAPPRDGRISGPVLPVMVGT